MENQSKSIMCTTTDLEGSSFAERSVGEDGRFKDKFEKKFWIDTEC